MPIPTRHVSAHLAIGCRSPCREPQRDGTASCRHCRTYRATRISARLDGTRTSPHRRSPSPAAPAARTCSAAAGRTSLSRLRAPGWLSVMRLDDAICATTTDDRVHARALAPGPCRALRRPDRTQLHAATGARPPLHAAALFNVKRHLGGQRWGARSRGGSGPVSEPQLHVVALRAPPGARPARTRGSPRPARRRARGGGCVGERRPSPARPRGATPGGSSTPPRLPDAEPIRSRPIGRSAADGRRQGPRPASTPGSPGGRQWRPGKPHTHTRRTGAERRCRSPHTATGRAAGPGARAVSRVEVQRVPALVGFVDERPHASPSARRTGEPANQGARPRATVSRRDQSDKQTTTARSRG